MKLFVAVLILGLAGSYFVQGDEGNGVTEGPEAGIPERPDLTCEQISRRDGGMLTCNPDGSFPEYRCINDSICFCIGQEYGERTSGVLNRDEAMTMCDQDDDDCVVERGGMRRVIQHGDGQFVELPSGVCQRCECNNANIACRNVTCPTKTATCSYMGREYSVGESIERDCYECRCVQTTDDAGRDGPGMWNCPSIRCPGEETEPECECDDAETEPVCYRGTTYRNRCLLDCRGVQTELIRPGACRDQDPCTPTSCSAGEVCHRREYSCMVRSCSFFNCSAACDASPPAGHMVCGSDGTSYASRCHLEAARTAGSDRLVVRYLGACDTTRCPDERVCGVDGVTYRSRCGARFRNVRIDYSGACQKNPDDVDCRVPCSEDNQVKPYKAVCPICGGICNIAYDSEGLSRLIAARSAPREYIESLAGMYRQVNASIPIIHRLALITQCRASVDLAVDAIEVIYMDTSADGGRSRYCRDAARLLRFYLTEGREPTDDDDLKLETGIELYASIPPRDWSITTDFDAVLSTASTSYTQSTLAQGSSAAAAGATLASVLLFSVLGFLVTL